MNFISTTFLVFLTLVFAVYWAIRRRRGQNLVLLVASYVFYSWWDWRFCGLLLISSLVDYGVGLGLGRTRATRARRLWLILSLVVNLVMLGFFKYFNFFAENFQQLLASFGLTVNTVTLRIVLPVGISFYTFQTLSYTIDVYRGRIKPTKSLLDYGTFVSFFPQLVAGPIERAPRLLPQFQSPRRFDAVEAREGCRFILWGCFKKVVIADSLATIVDPIYGSPEGAVGPQFLLATMCFAFQIYCDFSGYSDIAIGTGRLFGIRLVRNFAYPLFSQSPAEFWRRWHISLTTWFRDYVYIPLGGSRKSGARRAAAIIATFTLCGFWHGASWTFVVWGFVNALAVVPATLRLRRPRARVTERPAGSRLFPGPGVLLRVVATFSWVSLTLVLFRSPTFAQAGHIFAAMAGAMFDPETWAVTARYVLGGHEVYQPLYYLGVFIFVEWVQRGRMHALQLPRWPRPARWLLYSLLIWMIFKEGATPGNDFIYFQF
ncbi:MAG: MBOAT family O-acyltransferase [Planctomycetota bacterium]